MLKNYFKIAWRTIIKNPFHATLNIVGLATGIALALLIGVFVWEEMQVNRDLKNEDNQYIIQSRWKDPHMGIELTSVGPLAKRMKEVYPNLVANYYRWYSITTNISLGNRHFREGLQIGDSTFLSMYGFSLIDGDAKTALGEPYSVVINSDKAIKYFGRTNVVGEILTVENTAGEKRDFKITGVLKRPHENSITLLNSDNDNGLYFTDSDSSFFRRSMAEWKNIYIMNYLELQKGVSAKSLEKPLEQLIKREAPQRIGENLHPFLVPLKSYYLDKNGGVVRKMIYTLSFIVLFILAMAIINFINISISKTSGRMEEVGIRKVLGGLKKQLIIQFLIESVIVVFFATVVALGMYELARTYFKGILGKEIPHIFNVPAYFGLISIVLSLAIGLLAGFYPALVLSSLKPIESLKGKVLSVKSNIFLRKSLVAFQFCTASIAFIAAIIISQQVSFFFKNLGYDKDYIISAQVPRDWTLTGVEHMETVRNEFASLPQLQEASVSFEIPNGNSGENTSMWKAGQDSTSAAAVVMLSSDKDYAKTYGIPLAAGTFFDDTNDSLKIVINETAAKSIGWQNPGEAIGRQVKIAGYAPLMTIAGVTKDFHFSSMQGKIEPLVFLNVYKSLGYRYLSFKVKPGNIGSAIDVLQRKWSEVFPSTPFEFAFMDDKLKDLYQNELKLKQASYISTVLSLIIVLLGVLGLVSLSIQNRTKEIGIRKVLGSTVVSIVNLFLKEFLIVILIAGVIACPLAYVIMITWLGQYAYKINITAQPFIIAIFSLGLITTLLIIIQTIRVALANPAKSLKTE